MALVCLDNEDWDLKTFFVNTQGNKLLQGLLVLSTSEGKKMPKKRATTGGKLQKPLRKKISYSQ